MREPRRTQTTYPLSREGWRTVKTGSNSIYLHSSEDQKAMLFLKDQYCECKKVQQRGGLSYTPIPVSTPELCLCGQPHSEVTIAASHSWKERTSLGVQHNTTANSQSPEHSPLYRELNLEPPFRALLLESFSKLPVPLSKSAVVYKLGTVCAKACPSQRAQSQAVT